MDSKFPDPCKVPPAEEFCLRSLGHEGECLTVPRAYVCFYNPYTGLPRHPKELRSDPYGLLIKSRLGAVTNPSLFITEPLTQEQMDVFKDHYPVVVKALPDEAITSSLEVIRLRELAASCYAGLGAECNLPDEWLDTLLAASCGQDFSTQHLLPHARQHGPAEALYIEQADSLNCPACGGSGHVEDVISITLPEIKVVPPDPVLVACITLNGITLTVPVGELDSQLAEFQPGDTYDLTFKTMTRAELEALGEFNGF